MANIFSGLVRIGSDPSVRYTPNGKAVLNFSAANSTGFGEKRKTMWLRVTYWNNPEKMVELISKGDLISIAGELTQSEFNANDGTTKTSLELNASFIDLTTKKDSNQQSCQSSQPAQQRPQAQQQPRDNFDAMDDDIPFASLNWQIRAHLI